MATTATRAILSSWLSARVMPPAPTAPPALRASRRSLRVRGGRLNRTSLCRRSNVELSRSSRAKTLLGSSRLSRMLREGSRLLFPLERNEPESMISPLMVRSAVSFVFTETTCSSSRQVDGGSASEGVAASLAVSIRSSEGHDYNSREESLVRFRGSAILGS